MANGRETNSGPRVFIYLFNIYIRLSPLILSVADKYEVNQYASVQQSLKVAYLHFTLVAGSPFLPLLPRLTRCSLVSYRRFMRKGAHNMISPRVVVSRTQLIVTPKTI